MTGRWPARARRISLGQAPAGLATSVVLVVSVVSAVSVVSVISVVPEVADASSDRAAFAGAMGAAPSALGAGPSTGTPSNPARSARPRIVNFINFVRGLEPRNPRLDLLEPVREQMALAKRHGVPITFLVQYDALIQPRFVELLQREQSETCEIGAWLEIVQPLVERAGLPWRGRFAWDWRSHVGFSIGYTPAERLRLVDVFMKDFQARFGRYPRSVGSWFIDAHTLGYLADRYGVIASCSCKEQLGNDGYTLWGGYWGQGYYPSRVNAFMPAQNAAHQIPIVIFRMSGSDPVDQYAPGLTGKYPGIITLEPACPVGGGSPPWVRWYFDFMRNAPCLAFGYTHVGQENSYGWSSMAEGLNDQIPFIADLARRGQVRVMTLESAARWFRSRFPVTPATAVTALMDSDGRDRSSIWYNSRYYRVNFMSEYGWLRIRDLHLFDERYREPFLEKPTTATNCVYETLPVMDGLKWSGSGQVAAVRPVAILADGSSARLRGGRARVAENGASELRIAWPIAPTGDLEFLCRSSAIEVRCVGCRPSERWALEMTFGPSQPVPTPATGGRALRYRQQGYAYALRCSTGSFLRPSSAPAVIMVPAEGRLVLDFATPPGSP